MPDNKNKPNQSNIKTIDRITPEMNQFMDIIRMKESSDRSGVRNKKGSAYGYYQVIGSTLDAYNNKYGTNYTLNTREEQHEFMRMMMLESQEFFKKNNIPETVDNYYKKHVIGDNTKFLKFYKASQSNGPLSNFLTQKEINDNPGLFKDKDGRVLNAGEANNKINSFINSGKELVKKQPAERKKQIELEKRGIYEGRATPLDLRPGSYVNDGKAEWHPNSRYFNGQKLGEQSNDFIISTGDTGKKVIMSGSKDENDVDNGFTPKEYDRTMATTWNDNEWYGRSNDTSTSSTASTGFDLSQVDPNLQSFNIGPSNMDLSVDQIRNPQVRNQGQPQLSRADVLNATATYANEKNPYTSAGNIPHLVEQDQKGNPVIMNNPNNLQVNTDTFLNANVGNLTNPDNPQANNQYEQGGNLNNNNMNKANSRAYEEGNQGLISFNEGGTHNENPYGGIPQNNNPDGSINKVEEGETKQGDYVFSNNLKVTKELAEELRLPKQVENKTFAEASKVLNSVLEENGSDPIVKRTVNKQLDQLKLGNEKAKEENEINQQQVRQAQFEMDNVDMINDMNNQADEQANQELNQQEQLAPNMSNFSEEDLNMFNDGGNLDAVGAGINGGIQLASTLAFADDPNQEEKIKPGNSALQGAAAGASLGSVAGPWGTAIGAVVGGIGGLVVGSSKAKKQERILNQKELQRQDRALAPFRDPRSESGFIEDREVFNNGGDLSKGLPFSESDFGFDPNLLSSPNYLNNASYLGFNNANYIANNTVPTENLNELVIDVNQPSRAIVAPTTAPVMGTTSTSSNDIGFDSLANTTASRTNTNDQSNNFRGRGENLMQYASLLGSYQDMRNSNAKQPIVETLRASGTRMMPHEVDVNSIMNELRYSANTADSLIQRNSNGNSAAARANLLANRLNTNRATSEAMIRAEEYNQNQRAQALQYNNTLDQYLDNMYNQQSQINAQNRSALDRERAVRRQQFLTNLGNFGREQSNRNAAYNLSGGYDRYGNKGGFDYDALAEALFKQQNNNAN